MLGEAFFPTKECNLPKIKHFAPPKFLGWLCQCLCTPWGSFQYTRCCFGLSNSPQSMQHLMDWLTADFDNVEGYIDDRKDPSLSAIRLEVWFSTSLHLPRAYSRGSARLAVRWACRLSWPNFLRRTPIALISAFNIQVEFPYQQIFRCSIVWAHATTSSVI